MTMKALVLDADWEPRPGYLPSEHERSERRAREGSAIWRNPRLSVGERPTPDLSGPQDVLVAPRACGVCGSDVHMVQTDDEGWMLLPYHVKLPIAIGHEFAGEVVAVGGAVESVRIGDAVAVEAMHYCGSCRACQRGMFNHCVAGQDDGFDRDGGAAELVRTTAAHCWSLNEIRERFGDQRAYEIGALMEPTSVAYNGMFVRAGGFRPGEPVVVFGCGPIGLAAVALARAAGASRILALDPSPQRLELAIRVGADAACDARDLAAAGADAATELRALTGGPLAAMAVEASGAGTAVMPQLSRCLDYGAKVVLLGVESGTVPMRTFDYQMTAAQIFGSMGHLCGGFGSSIALHAAGRMDLSPIVTRRFELERGVEAIERTAQRDDAKVLILPGA